jgi:hypothetical protein
MPVTRKATPGHSTGRRYFDALLKTHVVLTRALSSGRPRVGAPLASLLPGGDAHALVGQVERRRDAQSPLPRRPGATDLHRALQRSRLSLNRRSYSSDVTAAAGEYLFHELISGDAFVVSNEADQQYGVQTASSQRER